LALEADSVPNVSSGGRRLALGAVASGGVSLAKVALQLLLLPLMARLLGPTEFGIYALALPTVSLVALLADGGLGNTLAREDETATLVWSSAFWALLLMGIALALGATGFGFLMSHFSHQPRLGGMIALLSTSLVFLTLSVVPGARLVRRKHLGTSAGIDLLSTAIGAIIAVAMAWFGGGAWSLAAQYVATFASRAILLNMAAFHLPELRFSFEALYSHLVSGGIMVASRICEYSGRVTETFLINYIFGTTLLGNFTFANQIGKFVTDAAANVIWSALYVQALSGDRQSIALLHRRLCRLLGLALFPTMFLAAIAAPELVSLFLGPKWEGLSFLLRIFFPLYSFSVICSQTAPILLAYGRFDIFFWCMAGLSTGRVVAIILGLWVGFAGAIYGIAAVTLVFCAAMLIFPANPTGCRPLPVLLGLVRPAIASILAVAVYSPIMSYHEHSTLWMFIALAAGFLTFGFTIILIDYKDLMEDWAAVRKTMSRRAA
jgi:O-antigen/teichoic acid export membrane protein